MPDFMSTDDPWFRPVYLEMGPDGALYIADFYNRIIGHYEVALDHPGRDRERGRIWRIVPVNADGTPHLTPIRDLSTENAGDLVADLARPNMTLRFLATSELTDRLGPAAIKPARAAAENPANAFQEVHALWVLHRLGALDFPLLARAAQSEDPVIRTQAIRIAGEMRSLSPEAHEILISGLRDANAFARRAAAEALGKHPDFANIRPLLDARAAAALTLEDTHLFHTVRLALRDQLSLPGAFAKLSTLSSQDVEAIGDVCPGVPGEDSAAFLAERLGREIPLSSENLKHTVRYIAEPRIEAVIEAARAAQINPRKRINYVNAAADAIAQRGAKPGPALRGWAEEAVAAVFADASAAPGSYEAAAEVCQRLKLPDSQNQLVTLLENRKADVKARAAAAAAIAVLDPAASIAIIGPIVADDSAPSDLRDKCGGTLGSLNAAPARAILLQAITTAPQGLQKKLALAIANDETGATELIDAVSAKKVTARILQERNIMERLNVLNKPALKARAEELIAHLPPLNDDVQRLIKIRSTAYNPKTASAERGAQIFKTICAVCHSIGGQGGQVGPPLDGVGARGVERLTEDIFDPSRNVDPAFRYSTVTLAGGTVFNGLFRRDEGAQLVFVDATGHEVTAAKDKIQSRIESTSSLMPDGFGLAFPPEQYNDLIAFLISKPKQ
jgi:putative heme-binding domain-containing protein